MAKHHRQHHLKKVQERKDQQHQMEVVQERKEREKKAQPRNHQNVQ